MTGPPPAVARARRAVTAALTALLDEARTGPGDIGSGDIGPGDTGPGDIRPGDAGPDGGWPGVIDVERGDRPAPRVLVACSGGADSLALAAAAAAVAPRLGLELEAVIVDHGLQDGSAGVAERAAEQCRGLGIGCCHIETVRVDRAAAGGLESAARTSRHRALARVADHRRALAVLLAHTADDQAEQVLLALARGSGTDAVAGIPRRRGRLLRPFLGDGRHDELRIFRADTEAVCAAHGLEVHHDPMNEDPALLRSRVRGELMPHLRAVLGDHLPAQLARAADLARADAALLAAQARELRAAAERTADPAAGHLVVLATAPLAAAPAPLRTRVLRDAAREAADRNGTPSGKSLTARHVNALDDLVIRWRGQGPIPLPGNIGCARLGGELVLTAT